LVFGLTGLVYFVLGAFGGMLADRFGPRRVALADRLGRPLTLVAVPASLGLSMLLWAWADGHAALAVFALCMGVSYGGTVSLMPAMCMDVFGAPAVSSIIGVLYTGAALGNLAGPWVAGRVFDATGSYLGVIIGCAVLSAAATMAAWKAAQQAAGRLQQGVFP
jgi:MFS family permease